MGGILTPKKQVSRFREMTLTAIQVVSERGSEKGEKEAFTSLT